MFHKLKAKAQFSAENFESYLIASSLTSKRRKIAIPAMLFVLMDRSSQFVAGFFA